MRRKKEGQISQTLEKGLRILDLYCGDESSFGLSEISRRLGVNKTTVYRYVTSLCDLGYLCKDSKDKNYSLGLKTIPLAHSFLQKANIVRQIKPVVDEIHLQHDLHIDVGIMQNESIYLVYRRESKDTLAFLHFTTGTNLYSLATGKAALSFMAEDAQETLIEQFELEPRTDFTITNKGDLRHELAETKKRGYSVNREEFLPGLISLGAPIFDLRSSEVTGGVSFDSSTAKFSMDEFEEKYASLLVELAKTLSVAITI